MCSYLFKTRNYATVCLVPAEPLHLAFTIPLDYIIFSVLAVIACFVCHGLKTIECMHKYVSTHTQIHTINVMESK